MVEEPEEIPSSNTSSTYSSASLTTRPVRPFVPRIDPFAVNRIGSNGELTPASSHSSSGLSPVSPGAGKRSPFLHPPRKATVPIMRRPPSPELLSQDCAFPPFPTSKVKGKSNTGNTSGISSRKSSLRGRAITPEAGASSTPFEREAKRSASLGAPRSRLRQGTNDSSRPSTASSSRQPSISSRAGSCHGSIDEVPPLPALQPSLSHTTTASEPDYQQVEPPNAWTSSPDMAQPPSAHQGEFSPFPELANQDKNGSYPGTTLSATEMVDPMTMQPQFEPIVGQTTHEPSYRTKRPAPIDSIPFNGIAELSMERPEPSPREAPPATPTSAIARTLTTLFGRKRNQSSSSKKGARVPATSGPRFDALSPDPHPMEQIIAEPESEQRPASRNSTDTEMVTTPPVHGVQQVAQASAGITPPEILIPEPSQAQILEPEEPEDIGEHDQRSRESVQMEQDLDNTLAAVTAIPRLSTVPEQAEVSRRASIDSASSYGSEGFSHSRASSLSLSQPNAHSYGSSISTARTTTSSEEFLSPAFAKLAKLRGPDVAPDSPTDPYMHTGRLAPVPEQRTTSPEESPGDVSPSSFPVPPVPENDGGYFDLAIGGRQRRPSTPGSNRGMCRGCSRMILPGQKSVSSKDGRLTGRYHKECFVCKTCKEPFATADFYVHEDMPYCAHDYHVINETLCESCGQGIEGHYLETSNLSGNGSKKFHPHCLRCGTCKIQLHEDYFELGGRVYCEKDAFRMININNVNGPRSPYGTAPSRPSPLNREYISSNEPGQILAAGRFPERRLTRLITTS